MCLPGLPDSLGNGDGVPDGKNGSEKTREFSRPHPARADYKEGLSREEHRKFANANRKSLLGYKLRTPSYYVNYICTIGEIITKTKIMLARLKKYPYICQKRKEETL